MSKALFSQTSFSAGISFSDKEGPKNSVAFLRAIDHRSDPKSAQLNPRAEKDSGSVVTDLPMWGTRACARTFAYGNTGKLYQKEGSTWTVAHTAADSQGNGLEYFTADGALYYAQDTTFGRLLDACTGATFYDDFLGSEGGEPTNTKSIDFERSSSMYASRADTASTSITADLTIEAYLKPESLPSSGEIYTLVSKWDEQSNKRSYKMDITTSSNFFGDGSDGSLTISSNTTEAPIDSSCSGTIDTYSLTATNASFVAGQKILIHQTRGTNAGVYQLTSIASYTAGTITTADPLEISYSSTGSNKAQVRVLKQHTDVTVNAGITYTAKAWNPTTGVGGIIGWYANGTTTINGTVTADAKGFIGGNSIDGAGATCYTGEGTGGATTQSHAANGNGGGGGQTETGLNGISSEGGGGGNATSGNTGRAWQNGGSGYSLGTTSVSGVGGSSSGSSGLSTMTFGGGGGGGGHVFNYAQGNFPAGGNGGGIILPFTVTLTMGAAGVITADGGNGENYRNGMLGGGGAGGSILIKTQTATLGTTRVTANGGTGAGVVGSEGRIHVDYLTSVSGTSSPNYTSAQDSTLGSSVGYVLRLLLSSNGTNSETYTQSITGLISTSDWARWAVSWENTTSTANFYRNGVLIGTKMGAFTSINDNASKFAIATDFDSAGAAQNFYDGLMDDVRVWNDVRTASELVTNNDQVLFGTEANLIAYYQFTSDVTDSQTDGLNDLTATNSPTYSNDVPFSGVTTRNDQDQGLTSGSFVQSYTLATSINEGATHRQTFVPTRDPQKSIIVDIDTVGTGDWTLTVHDSLNRTVATKTIANAELHTSFFEFIFADVWRPILGASYHFHLTSTVADGLVDTTGANDLETAYFTTHFQFLVEDQYHPIKEMLDFMVIGNERYLAKYEAGNVFNPHRLTFPSGYRVRCLAYWREYLVIGCWKGTSITDYDDGRIFFWDGISDTYNHSIPVPEGGVNAMFGTQDVLYIVAGYTGEILVYTGGGSAQKFNKIPKLVTGEYIEVAPGSMSMWRSNIHFGVNLNTDSSTVYKGVYSIGSANVAYPPSLGFDYPTSLGEQTSSSVKVSMIFPSGQDLYVGWQNGNAFGIDAINPTNDVYDSGTIELLITDLGSISAKEYPLRLRADFKPLNSGESVRMKYKSDRETNFKVGTYEDSVNAKQVVMEIKEQCKEIQVVCDVRTTASTSPVLLGITLESEQAEGDIRA